ncbi:MAG TPA: DUF1499 domain-containing protein [Casimicrobiaceae bacterium]|nr:DUF1499 domain-containing protein [Casimicrobiaceae bacterium]
MLATAGWIALMLPAPRAAAAWFGRLFAGTPPELGVVDGALRPCPDKPNCVSSQAADSAHAIAPFRYDGEMGDAMTRLADVVAAQQGAVIVSRRAGYLRAEFTSRIMGFVDDVEFTADAPSHTIHVRSASRLGYSDLGVNRARVENLRRQFAVPSHGSPQPQRTSFPKPKR